MGSTRREFVKLMAGGAMVSSLPRLAAQSAQAETEETGSGMDLAFRSSRLSAQMAPDQPGFIALAVDSLGKNKLDGNVMLPLAKSAIGYKVSRENHAIRYFLAEADDSPVWTFEFDEHGFGLPILRNCQASRWFLASRSIAMRRCLAS